MGRNALLWLLVLGGLSLVAAAVLADAAGIGGNAAFGLEQKLGVLVGMSVVWFASLRLAGWAPTWRRLTPSPAESGAPATA